MSRIHDALKRLEQQKEQTPGAAPNSIETIFSNQDLVVATPEPADAARALYGDAPQELVTPSTVVPAFCSKPSITWNLKPQLRMFIDDDMRASGVEEFRTLRTRLIQISEKAPFRVMLVGSALPGEGKSFVAANLAQAFSLAANQRVLLVDADLRRSSLHLALGTFREPGLSDFLMSSNFIEDDCVQRCPLENLYFIPSGKAAKNPAELIGLPRLAKFMNWCRANFDWVVVDSPPAMPIADSTQIAKFCDGVVLVVDAKKTPRTLVQKTMRMFGERSVAGVVLNNAGNEGLQYQGYYGTPSQDEKQE